APPTIPVKSWVRVAADDGAARTLAKKLRNDVKRLDARSFCHKVRLYGFTVAVTDDDLKNLKTAGLVHTPKQTKNSIIEVLSDSDSDDSDSADGDYDEDEPIEYVGDREEGTNSVFLSLPPFVQVQFHIFAGLHLEFGDMSVDQAKACSHSRLTLEGKMDAAREKIVRDLAAAAGAPSGVANFPVGPDSSDSEDDTGHRNSSDNTPSTPRPTALRHGDLGRTEADTSAAPANLPVIYCPACIEPECNQSGNMSMVSCNICKGNTHRFCGVLSGTCNDDGETNDFEGTRCSPCAAANKGKKAPIGLHVPA
ncbi:unnamed protein product, partial [Ectocarpus sp. 12 AP-2014]